VGGKQRRVVQRLEHLIDAASAFVSRRAGREPVLQAIIGNERLRPGQSRAEASPDVQPDPALTPSCMR
jgi:hypothetical protein